MTAFLTRHPLSAFISIDQSELRRVFLTLLLLLQFCSIIPKQSPQSLMTCCRWGGPSPARRNGSSIMTSEMFTFLCSPCTNKPLQNSRAMKPHPHLLFICSLFFHRGICPCSPGMQSFFLPLLRSMPAGRRELSEMTFKVFKRGVKNNVSLPGPVQHGMFNHSSHLAMLP